VEIEYSDKAEKDASEWIQSGNKKAQDRITHLIENIIEAPTLYVYFLKSHY